MIEGKVIEPEQIEPVADSYMHNARHDGGRWWRALLLPALRKGNGA
ncbi:MULTISPECIES: hypothetical protein [Halomonadaceae]|nr:MULTISPECIES: hypothetical protein [Halomonas]UDM08209.1 hypothetical protein LG409_04700 [Halomonas sp. NyZ770]